MENILEELYFGNICPNEKHFDGDSAYGKLAQLLSTNENKLTELLEDKEKKLFLDYANAHNELNATGTMESFTDGFRLGARIMLEILWEEPACLRDVR